MYPSRQRENKTSLNVSPTCKTHTDTHGRMPTRQLLANSLAELIFAYSHVVCTELKEKPRCDLVPLHYLDMIYLLGSVYCCYQWASKLAPGKGLSGARGRLEGRVTWTHSTTDLKTFLLAAKLRCFVSKWLIAPFKQFEVHLNNWKSLMCFWITLD